MQEMYSRDTRWVRRQNSDTSQGGLSDFMEMNTKISKIFKLSNLSIFTSKWDKKKKIQIIWEEWKRIIFIKSKSYYWTLHLHIGEETDLEFSLWDRENQVPLVDTLLVRFSKHNSHYRICSTWFSFLSLNHFLLILQLLPTPKKSKDLKSWEVLYERNFPDWL